jgi:hypothetical protein
MVFACVCAQVVGRKMKQAVLDQSEGEITKHSAGRFFFGILKRVNEGRADEGWQASLGTGCCRGRAHRKRVISVAMYSHHCSSG